MDRAREQVHGVSLYAEAIRVERFLKDRATDANVRYAI
jgi:hypothetical protein